MCLSAVVCTESYDTSPKISCWVLSIAAALVAQTSTHQANTLLGRQVQPHRDLLATAVACFDRLQQACNSSVPRDMVNISVSENIGQAAPCCRRHNALLCLHGVQITTGLLNKLAGTREERRQRQTPAPGL